MRPARQISSPATPLGAPQFRSISHGVPPPALQCPMPASSTSRVLVSQTTGGSSGTHLPPSNLDTSGSHWIAVNPPSLPLADATQTPSRSIVPDPHSVLPQPAAAAPTSAIETTIKL